jgi:Icc-related predicted phosphoesterase
VAGVAGNHDDFGNTTDFEYFKKQQNIHYLQKQIKQIDTLKIAGISGIIGKPDKPQRVDEAAYLKILKELLLKQADFVLLHESPDTINEGFEGNSKIRQTILASPPNTVFCGHSHWAKPLAMLENKTQVANLDGRAIIFINEK